MRTRGTGTLLLTLLCGLAGCGDASEEELTDSADYPVRCDKNPSHKQCNKGSVASSGVGGSGVGVEEGYLLPISLSMVARISATDLF